MVVVVVVCLVGFCVCVLLVVVVVVCCCCCFVFVLFLWGCSNKQNQETISNFGSVRNLFYEHLSSARDAP